MSEYDDLKSLREGDEVQLHDFGRIEELSLDEDLEEVEFNVNDEKKVKDPSPSKSVHTEARRAAMKEFDTATRRIVIVSIGLLLIIWLVILMSYPMAGLYIFLLSIPCIAFIVLSPRLLGYVSPVWITKSNLAGLFFEGLVGAMLVLMIQIFLFAIWGSIMYGSQVAEDEFDSISFKDATFFFVTSFFILAFFSEYAKYKITNAYILDRVNEVPSRIGFVLLSVAASLGYAFLEGIIVVSFSTSFAMTIAQILLVFPLHCCTGIGIGLSLALKRINGLSTKLYRILALPIIVQGLQHFMGFFLLADDAPLWPYYLLTYILLACYSIYLILRSKSVPNAFILVPDEVPLRHQQEA